ncbi:protein kinase [Streptomyces sp. NPDC059989]|uniref:protein kinase domain-containing protein n=1 Tax=Streptomyces sp. NPDC059989 TaxID=3347026 RepID=UPI003675B0AF
MSKPETPAAQPDGVEPVPAAAEPDLAGSPAAKPGSESGAAPAGSPTAKPGAVPAEPEDAKPEPARSPAAEPGSEAGVAPAGSPAAKPGAVPAEPEDAKPEPARSPAAKPGAGKPGVAPVEPEDAKSEPAVSAAAKPGAVPAEAEDVKSAPAAAEAGLAKAKAAPVKPTKGEDGKAAAGKTGLAKAGAAPAKSAVAEQAKPAAAKDLGRLLAGRYRLGAVLGKGGMGTVWRAEDETLGRTVAVKELRFSTGVDEDEKRRLITRTLREAKAIARIRSGGAVTVYDVVDEDGRPWIVMELIEGPSLADFIRENGPLTPHRAAEVGLAVLDVLRAAHGQGILHRDVKPSNVLIAASGRVVLTDFGIAQVEGDPSVTSTGMLVGAPSYISPERARGYKPGPPADMWSLGGLLYAAVEGVPPYDKGSALATLTAVMTEPVDPPKNAGPLTEVIYGLLAKDPAHRLDDDRARAMLTAVLNAPEPVPAPEPAPAAEATRQISLADAKEAADKAAAEKAAEKAAKKERERREREQRERARAALKSARKAAAGAAATKAASAAEAPAAPAAKPKAAPVAAPLTDVMPRRTIALAIAAVVVVLAAVGSLIAYAVSGDDNGGRKDEGKNGGGKPTPGVSASQSPGGTQPSNPPSSPQSSPKAGDPGAGQGQQTPSNASGGGTASQGQGASPGGSGSGLPAGYALVTDPGFHFSMAMPEGFHLTGIAGKKSGGIYSRDGGFPRIQVDYNGSPGDDARKAWLELAPGTASSSTNYKLLRIDLASYRNYPTVADWEFERDHNGVRVRVLNRGFKMDATHGYAIMISCPADQWDGPECTQMRTTAFETFQPLG